MYSIRLLLSFLFLSFVLFLPIAGNTQAINTGFYPILKNSGSEVYALAGTADGKIVVGGSFTSSGSKTANKITRLNADGTLDDSFNQGGTGANGIVRTIAIQPDGKIIIGGDFTSYNGTSINRIARLNTDGSLDESFMVGSGAEGAGGVYDLVIQPDGKIIAVGLLTKYKGIVNNSNRIVRIMPNGDKDPSFKYGTGPSEEPTALKGGMIRSVALQGDKIIIGGDFTYFDGKTQNYVARLNADGSLDETFALNQTGPDKPVYAVTVHNNQVLIGGDFTSYNGVEARKLAKLDANGLLLPASEFNVGTGAPGITNIRAIDVQSDGKIVISGNFTSFNNSTIRCIARLNPNGSVDESFTAGVGANATIGAILLQGNNILAGGAFSMFNTKSTSLISLSQTNGSINTDFNPSLEATGTINTIALQPNGMILLGGNFTNITNGDISKNHKNITRLKGDDSTIDTNFDPGTGAEHAINALTLQNDGKIIAVGDFTKFNGKTANRIVRLNENGSLDDSFKSGSGANGNITSIIRQDDKLIITGYFSQYNGNNANRVARINADGSFDNTFAIGSGADGERINGVVIDKNGKIVLAGKFTSFNGSPAQHLVRLNADGTIDNSFTSAAEDAVTALAIQPDGKIIIGGFFTKYGGTATNRLARINENGSFDNTFSVGAGADNTVKTLAILNSGKVLVGGDFNNFNNESVKGFTRLNPDGSRDNFNLTVDGPVNAMVVMDDISMFLAGAFSTINDQPRTGIALINYPSKASEAITFKGEVDVFPNPSNGVFALLINSKNKLTSGNVVIYNIAGQQVLTVPLHFHDRVAQHSFELQGLKSGMYMLQVTTDKGRILKKLIIE